MIVYLVMENSDNASPASVHRTLEGAKVAAETTAGKITDGHSREWKSEDSTEWLYERIGDGASWPIFSVEPFTVRD